jgi:hypothetical protein
MQVEGQHEGIRTLLCHTHTVFHKLIRGLKSDEWAVRRLAELCANMTVRFQTSANERHRYRTLIIVEIRDSNSYNNITMKRTLRLDHERCAVSQTSEVEILRVLIKFPEGSIS